MHRLQPNANRLGLHILVHGNSSHDFDSRCSLNQTLLRVESRRSILAETLRNIDQIVVVTGSKKIESNLANRES
jgi:hypothetical protein